MIRIIATLLFFWACYLTIGAVAAQTFDPRTGTMVQPGQYVYQPYEPAQAQQQPSQPQLQPQGYIPQQQQQVPLGGSPGPANGGF